MIEVQDLSRPCPTSGATPPCPSSGRSSQSPTFGRRPWTRSNCHMWEVHFTLVGEGPNPLPADSRQFPRVLRNQGFGTGLWFESNWNHWLPANVRGLPGCPGFSMVLKEHLVRRNVVLMSLKIVAGWVVVVSTHLLTNTPQKNHMELNMDQTWMTIFLYKLVVFRFHLNNSLIFQQADYICVGTCRHY